MSAQKGIMNCSTGGKSMHRLGLGNTLQCRYSRPFHVKRAHSTSRLAVWGSRFGHLRPRSSAWRDRVLVQENFERVPRLDIFDRTERTQIQNTRATLKLT